MAILRPINGPRRVPKGCTLPKYRSARTKAMGGVRWVSKNCFGGPWDGRHVAIPDGGTLVVRIGDVRGRYVWVTRYQWSDDGKQRWIESGFNWQSEEA